MSTATMSGIVTEKRDLRTFVYGVSACVAITAASLINPHLVHAGVLDLSSAMTDASSFESGTYTHSRAFDGDSSTRWASARNQGDNSWIWVDLGSDLTLQSVNIEWEVADANTYKLYRLTTAEAASIGFVGDGSDAVNLANWSEIASVENAEDGDNNDVDSFDFVNDTVTLRGSGAGTTSILHAPTARYLLTNPISDIDIHTGVSIYEVTVDANPVPEPSCLVFVSFGLLGLLLTRRSRSSG
jgi:hypothetical protein